MRFLWPDELGKVVPKRNTIEIEAVDHRYSPPPRQKAMTKPANGWRSCAPDSTTPRPTSDSTGLKNEHLASDAERLSDEMKARMREALDRNWPVSRDTFVNHHLAVNVATSAWGSWNYYARFGWSEPSESVRNRARNK